MSSGESGTVHAATSTDELAVSPITKQQVRANKTRRSAATRSAAASAPNPKEATKAADAASEARAS